MASLRVGEVTLESFPQLMTQWLFLTTQISLLKPEFVGMSFLQSLSVLTSTLAIIQSMVQFVAISRRQQFISRRYPSAASLLPLFLFFLSGVGAATTQFRWPLVGGSGLLFWILNVANFIFIVIILIMPCLSRLCWRVFRTICHFSVSFTAIGCVITTIVCFNVEQEQNLKRIYAIHISRFTFFCCIANALLGIAILPSKDWAPRMFTPIIRAFVRVLILFVNLCCPLKWRPIAREMLTGILSVEMEENEIVKELPGLPGETPGVKKESIGGKETPQVEEEE